MKAHFLLPTLLSFAALGRAFAQGTLTFTYDQQSADERHYQEGGTYIQQNQPVGQSFTPSLSAVGFIRIFVYSDVFPINSDATLSVNLRSGSITGSVLAATSPVFVPAGTAGYTTTVNFLFQNPVSVNPGQTYFFQPVVQSASTNFSVFIGPYNYSGGSAFLKGAASQYDLWFREGIYVAPEPSLAALVLVGGAIWSCLCRGVKREHL